MELLSFREVLAQDMLAEGYVPTEHITSEGTRYLVYTDPAEVEVLLYLHDPTCGNCGCPRVACLGAPPFGWDDLAREEGCSH